MVLVKCVLEGGTTLGRAGGLLTRTAADGGTTHQIIIFIVVRPVALLLDAPEDNTQNTNEDGTSDTYHDTDDDLLVRGRNAAAGRAAAAVERSRGGLSSRGGSTEHDSGLGRTADGHLGGDGLDNGSLSGRSGIRCGSLVGNTGSGRILR
jgi:hypothetical protein